MADSLNILLLEPKNDNVLTGGGGTTPLWPCVLSALTPKKHRMEFIHSSFEDITPDKIKGYDLVGISTRTETANHAYQLGDMCRKMGIKTVMGGIHAFACPEETGQHCDSIVLKEAEYLWPEVLEDAQKGELKYIYKSDYVKPGDFLVPDLSIVGKYRFKIENVLETVRGCPYNCLFCSATLYNGGTYRHKPVDTVIREVESWRRKSSFSLLADLNIGVDRGKAIELFTALKKYNLHWWGLADVGIGDDDELLALMAKAGCMYLELGLESISETTLKAMRKRSNLNVDYTKAIDNIHKHGIDVFCNFIFGMDTDTTSVFKDTVTFALDAGVDFPIYHILVPFPGTKIYETLEKEGRLTSKDWSRYTKCDVVYTPKNMSKQELLRGMFWAFEQSYSRINRFRRFLSRPRSPMKMIYNQILLSHFMRQFIVVRKKTFG